MMQLTEAIRRGIFNHKENFKRKFCKDCPKLHDKNFLCNPEWAYGNGHHNDDWCIRWEQLKPIIDKAEELDREVWNLLVVRD
ncbi:MAG: hypothetical protein IJ576_08705 [Synergistaceae bacterium]|nr:hypothetical protein [Synergistaceae bacterium]MBR1602008.1 hypothetical protein [Synergistaceae bacterium]